MRNYLDMVQIGRSFAAADLRETDSYAGLLLASARVMEGRTGGNVTHVSVQLPLTLNSQPLTLNRGFDFPVEWLRNGTEDEVAGGLRRWVVRGTADS